MERAFVTEAAGLRSLRFAEGLMLVLMVILAVAIAKSEVLVGCVLFAMSILMYGVAYAMTPLRFEVHENVVVAIQPWRRSTMSLEKVSCVRPARWWDIYRYFVYSHYHTDLGHPVVILPEGSGLMKSGWLLSPMDRDGFIDAVNIALTHYRRLHGAPL